MTIDEWLILTGCVCVCFVSDREENVDVVFNNKGNFIALVTWQFKMD